MKLTLTHTSPEEIKEIDKFGLLGENLCFSSEEYVMTAKSDYVVYQLDIDDDKIICASGLYDEEIVKEISDRFDVDEETAEKLLDGRESAWNHGGDADDNWWIQEQQGDCAKKMGYEACESEDEQGTVWIVPMMSREKDLVRVK